MFSIPAAARGFAAQKRVELIVASLRFAASMRIVFFLAIVANSLDLLATALGIHWLGNREGNPFLANLAHEQWWMFVLFKGLLIPLLLVVLYLARRRSRLAAFGLALCTIAMTVAVGQWIGWMAGVLHVAALPGF